MEKQCGNCGFFPNYYVISMANLCMTVRGCCMCNESKLKYKTMLKDDRGCPFWAAGDEKEEQQKEIIQNALLKMAKQIEEIALILTAEK